MGIWDKFKGSKQQQDGVDMTRPETMADKVQNNAIEPKMPKNTGGKKAEKGVKSTLLFLMLLVGFMVIVGGFAAFFSGKKGQTEELEQPEVLTTDIEKDGSGGFSLENDKDAIAEEERKRREEEARRKAELAQQTGDMPTGDTAQQPVVVQQQAPEEPKPDLTLERRLSGEVLVADSGKHSDETAQAQMGESGGVPRGFGEETAAAERPLNFTGSTFKPRIASRRGDRTLLLTKGTVIRCVLETKIVTDHAGLTKCRATQNVWSANGKTVLVERGTVFMGEQTAAMLQGQARVAVRWTQMETPKGILVDIDSPSVGKLGAAGNAAWVNTHFWQRFGGSIMISLIGDISNGVSKRIGKSHSDFTLEESSDNLEEMATEALRNSINIPPTGTINQGALVNIMVARDVDFSRVYERVDISEFNDILPTN